MNVSVQLPPVAVSPGGATANDVTPLGPGTRVTALPLAVSVLEPARPQPPQL